MRPGHETRSNPGNCGGVVGRNEVDRQVRGRHGRAGPQTVISVKHPSMFYYGTRRKRMPMYEATVRTPQGETKDRVYAKDLTEAKQLFEQRHGPRNVPYVPKIIPS